jgi:hypothetical protein
MSQIRTGQITSSSEAWQTWTPTIGGFSANPTGGIYTYQQIGKIVTLAIGMPNTGTSNATTITLSLPVTAATRTNMTWFGTGQVINNGASQTTPGGLTISSGATTLTVTINANFGAFTTSGAKSLVYGNITYEAA